MRAMVLRRNQRVVVEEVERPSPEPGWVRGSQPSGDGVRRGGRNVLRSLERRTTFSQYAPTRHAEFHRFEPEEHRKMFEGSRLIRFGGRPLAVKSKNPSPPIVATLRCENVHIPARVLTKTDLLATQGRPAQAVARLPIQQDDPRFPPDIRNPPDFCAARRSHNVAGSVSTFARRALVNDRTLRRSRTNSDALRRLRDARIQRRRRIRVAGARAGPCG